MTPAEWTPEWVQAVGSIIAIAAAAAIAILQSRSDHLRSQTLLLLGKLEQLYASILGERDRLKDEWELALPLRDVRVMSEAERREFTIRSRRPRIDRVIRMYAELYFPRLKDAASCVFDGNRAFTKLERAISKGESVTFSDFQRAYLAYENALSRVITEVKRETDNLPRRPSRIPRADASAITPNDAGQDEMRAADIPSSLRASDSR